MRMDPKQCALLTQIGDNKVIASLLFGDQRSITYGIGLKSHGLYIRPFVLQHIHWHPNNRCTFMDPFHRRPYQWHLGKLSVPPILLASLTLMSLDHSSCFPYVELAVATRRPSQIIFWIPHLEASSRTSFRNSWMIGQGPHSIHLLCPLGSSINLFTFRIAGLWASS